MTTITIFTIFGMFLNTIISYLMINKNSMFFDFLFKKKDKSFCNIYKSFIIFTFFYFAILILNILVHKLAFHMHYEKLFFIFYILSLIPFFFTKKQIIEEYNNQHILYPITLENAELKKEILNIKLSFINDIKLLIYFQLSYQILLQFISTYF